MTTKTIESLRDIYEFQKNNSVIGVPRDLVEELLGMTGGARYIDIRMVITRDGVEFDNDRSWDGPQNQ